jgi:Holliday junction DNA helicase RuvB
VGLLFGLESHDVLFIDEIHALPRPVIETLYEVMDGQTLSLQVTEGIRGRALTMRLPPITVVGATTEPHRLPPPLLSRFPLEETVEPYSDEDLARIITRAANRRGRTMTEDAALILARAARGTPRRAKALLSRTCDVAGACHLDAPQARAALDAAGIDPRGLGPEHRRALRHLRDRPIGTARLAALLGLTTKAFRTLLEPDLLRMGLVTPTPRGLVAVWCG